MSHSTSGYTPKRTESRDSNRYVHTHVHSSMFTAANRWQQPKCPSANKRKNKMQHTHNRVLLSLK